MNENSRKIEIMVGLFLLIGLLATAYVSLKLGNVSLLNRSDYRVYATFSNVAGLKKRAPVTMSGVEIGRVEDIVLDQNGHAKVIMRINQKVKLSEDCIASIKTMGIIGDKYIAISQGGLDSYIQPEGEIVDTIPPLDIEELVGKFVFGKIDKSSKTEKSVEEGQ